MPDGGDQNVPPIRIPFEEEGADETTAKVKRLIDVLTQLAGIYRKLAEEQKKRNTQDKSGGVSDGKGGDQTFSKQRQYYQQRIRDLTEELADLRKSWKYRDPSAAELTRERTLKRQILRMTYLDQKQHDREMNAAEQDRISHMSRHVRVINRAMQMVGLGRFAPGGQVGSAILNGLQVAGAPGVAPAAGQIGAMGWAGIGAGALIGGTAAVAGLAIHSTLGKSPAHALNMQAAGWLSPFEANESTREVSKVMANISRMKTKGFTDIASTVNSGLIGLHKFMATSIPWLNLQAAKMSHASPERIKELQGKYDESSKKATAETEAPTVGEVRYVQGLTGNMVDQFRPQSDMARMGLYASAAEGYAVGNQMEVWTKLVDAMQSAAATLKLIHEDQKAQAAAGGTTARVR